MYLHRGSGIQYKSVEMVNLGFNIGDLSFKNPVLTASGTFGYGTEYDDFFDVSALGGIILSSKLTTYRIEQLEKRVEEHNHVVERTYKLERKNAVYEEKFKDIVSNKLDIPIKFKPFVPPWTVPDIISELDYVLLPYDKAIPTESNVLKEAVLMGKNLIILKDGVFSIVEHKPDQNHSKYGSGEDYNYNHWIDENIYAIKSCIAH